MPINDMQTTNRQHAVPQNIMDVEFKIIGDLTMRQFIYLLAFGAIGYVTFISVGGLLKWPLVLLVVLAGIGFAFVPIEERGLDEWVINFIRAIYMPNQRVWKKVPQIPQAFTYESLNIMKNELITLTPTSSRRKLEEYLVKTNDPKNLDPLDIPEMEYTKMARQAFAGTTVAPPIQQDTTQQGMPQITAPYETGEETEPPGQGAPNIGIPKEEDIIPASDNVLPEEDKKDDKEEISTQDANEIQDPSHENLSTPPSVEAATQTQQEPLPEQVSSPSDPTQATPIQQPMPPEQAAQTQETSHTQQLPQEQIAPEPQQAQPTIDIPDEHYVHLDPITPDQHSGRKFTNLLPKQGEIILPIRGEKILQTTEEEKIDEDIDAKAEQLRDLLDQIRSDENYGDAVQEKGKDQPKTIELQQTEEHVEQELPLKPVEQDSIVTPKIAEQPKPEEHPPEIKVEQKPEPQPKQPEPVKEQVPQSVDTNSTPSRPDMLPLTTTPNVVSGIVQDSHGTSVEGVVLIVKNDKEEPVRALKSNQLGQFSISTPLTNGTYTIETDKSKKTGLTFDIIKFNVSGEVIPPVQISGR